MNYVKTKIAEKLYGKRVVEKVRNHEISLMEGIEQQYPYIHHTLPEQNMTEQQKKNHLKKIQKLSNWLDNALPGSPIPVGLDSLLVIKKNTK
jgi:hypothetical protein